MNLGTWRAATANEINTGQLPTGASLRQVITAGGSRSQRVLKTASKPEVVTVVSGDPSITYNADGSKNYIFSGGSGSGYAKSTCSTSGIPDCGSGSARFVIQPNGANSVLITAYKGSSGYAGSQYWSGYCAGATIDYRVSTAPSGGGGGGTIKVKSYTPEATAEQKYGYYVHVPASAEEQTKVFLVQQGSTAAQNFAFDIDEDNAIEWEMNT